MRTQLNKKQILIFHKKNFFLLFCLFILFVIYFTFIENSDAKTKETNPDKNLKVFEFNQIYYTKVKFSHYFFFLTFIQNPFSLAEFIQIKKKKKKKNRYKMFY